jgi:hypothetical protein
MTPPKYDASVHRQLGELVAGVKNLQESFRRSEYKSDQNRATMHRRLDEMVGRVEKVERRVASVQDDVTEMKPVTEDVRRWKLMGVGAFGVIGIGGIAMGVTFADAIRRVGAIVFGRRPHVRESQVKSAGRLNKSIDRMYEAHVSQSHNFCA